VAQPDPRREPDRNELVDCLGQASGRIGAAPDAIDRWTSLDRAVTVSWSVAMPENCRRVIHVYVTPRIDADTQFLPLAGSRVLPVHTTHTFGLQVGRGSDRRTLARTTVQVRGAPPTLLSVSPGRRYAATDFPDFKARWMQPYDSNDFLRWSCWQLRTYGDGAWTTAERMTAMVRMFDLTGDQDYLDELQSLTNAALMYRDDRHPDRRSDDFRGGVSPGWGEHGVNTGGLHTVGEVSSSILAYPIAAFARMVAERPTLHAAYGDSAIAYANAALQTAQLFLPQVKHWLNSGGRVAYLAQLESIRDRPSDADCQRAFDAAQYPDISAASISRFKTMRTNCQDLSRLAGLPFSHNENQAFMMLLIELWRVLGSEYYRLSPARATTAEAVRLQIPLIVGRYHRWFMQHVKSLSTGPVRFYYWNHAEERPAGVNTNPEDTSHGDLDMIYLNIFRENYARLNAVTSDWNEPLPPLGSSELEKFANTFLLKIASGYHFAKYVTGRPADPADYYDGSCVGWVTLTVANRDVFSRCQTVAHRVVNGQQPKLGIGNHAALLMSKQLLPGHQPREEAGPLSRGVTTRPAAAPPARPGCAP